MSLGTRLLILAALMAALGLYGALRKPYGTRLPYDVDDLSEIQPQLDRLGERERELVLGYLERSNGDVLPASMADPDFPFTARTFGEAIELQERFLREQAGRDAVAAQRRAERDRLLAPLRDALELRLVARELLTQDEALGLPADVRVKSADNGRRVLVVSYRLVNVSGRTIASAKGGVDVFDDTGRRRTHCWIDQADTLDAFAHDDVRCGNAMRTAEPDDRAFVGVPAERLTLLWEPAEIVFADGSRLTAPH